MRFDSERNRSSELTEPPNSCKIVYKGEPIPRIRGTWREAFLDDSQQETIDSASGFFAIPSIMSSKGSILLTGGTGKISSRITPLLASNGDTVLVASRSGKCPSLPNTIGVKFDWFDPATYTNPFSHSQVNTIFLIAPPIMDCLPPMKGFIDLAVQKGVKRLVLLSGSLLEVGDGPMMAQVSKYISLLGVEWTVLRPSWFMENFSEMEHGHSIRSEDRILTATGEGKVSFVSANDIAAVAFRALTDEVLHNTDHLILGPELFSYDDVAEILTKKLGREITHVKLTEDELADAMTNFGIPGDYASLLAQLDTAIKNGEEERLNSVILDVTGREPIRFQEFVERCVEKGVWMKK